MKILVDMGHPAHVHFFKNMIWKLEERGHEIKITARKKDVTLDLLDAYGFDYFVRGAIRTNLAHKALDMLKTDYRIYKVAKEFKPDILIGLHNPYTAQVGWIMRKTSITFTDTEISKLAGWLTFPFTDVICTPSCFQLDLGKKQVRYDGYQELAYLHPNYFKPDPSVLDDLDISKDDRFVIMRSVSWGASHDIGDKGFADMPEVIKSIEQYEKVLITSERPLSPKLEKYKISISPEKIHHLMYYAQLFVGESATMASECAVLGTPAIFVSTSRRGYTDEEEAKFGLVRNFSDPSHRQTQLIEEAVEFLQRPNLKKESAKKRERLLDDKIDVTRFMVELVEEWPESLDKLKEI